MSGFSVFSTSRVEVVVHAGGSPVVAGVIGGLVVLIGVVLTEGLIRTRERRTRLEEAVWSLRSAAHGGLLIGHVESMSDGELAARYAAFIDQLGRIRAEAKWPIRNREEIADEVDAITRRFMVAVGKWGAGKAGPPRLGPVLGEHLFGLVFINQKAGASQSLDDALLAEGLPTLSEITADDAPNKPPDERFEPK
jgi:hypothetical protein